MLMRHLLDAVGSLGFGLSRTRMAREVRAERVAVNGRVEPDPAAIVREGEDVLVVSLEKGGYGETSLRRNQIMDADSLLALRVNGATLSRDHGYPARMIAPGRPGVLQTKWLSSIEVLS